MFLASRFGRLVFFLVVIPVVGLGGCGDFDSKVGSRSTIFDENPEDIPNLVISNYRVTSYEKGNLKWIMVSDSARLFDKKQRTHLFNVDFKNYDEKFKETSSGVAGVSILENDTGNIVLEKDVVIVNTSGTLIEGEYFYWNDKNKRFTSPEYVKITKRDGSVISGTGFSANQELGDIEFKSKVSGQIGDGKKEDFFQGFN